MLLVWRLAVQVDPLGDRPQKELEEKIRELVHGDIRGHAKRSGIKFRLVTREVRQAVLGAELDREEDFYIALDGDHDVMLWLGAQLRV